MNAPQTETLAIAVAGAPKAEFRKNGFGAEKIHEPPAGGSAGDRVRSRRNSKARRGTFYAIHFRGTDD